MKKSLVTGVAVSLAIISAQVGAQNGRPAPVNKGPIKIGGTSGTQGGTDQNKSEPIKIGGSGQKSEKAKDPYKGMFGNSTADDWYKAQLKQPLLPKTYNWDSSSGKVTMDPVETHICVLTRINGNFAGSGERIDIVMDTGATGGARWAIVGQSGNNDLRASATCVERVKFVPFEMPIKQLMSGGEHVNHVCPPATFVDQPPIKAAGFLSSISGKLRGGGEGVAITQGPKGPTIKIQACSGHVLAAQELLYVPGHYPVKWRSDTGLTTNGSAANYAAGTVGNNDGGGWIFETNNWPASKSVKMTRVDEALCGFTGISGKFQGGGETASITAQKGPDGQMWWYLTVDTLAANAPIAASARCIARDQR